MNPTLKFYDNLKNFIFVMIMAGMNITSRYIDKKELYNIDMLNVISIYIICNFTIELFYVSPLFKLHHSVSIFLITIPLYSNYKYLELIYLFINFEISTIFLELSYLTNLTISKILFCYTFFYFRIYNYFKFLLYENNQDKVIKMCTNHDLYTANTCLTLLHLEHYIFASMNIYWSFLICIKMYKLLEPVLNPKSIYISIKNKIN
mgnify:CR=1 FL=1